MGFPELTFFTRLEENLVINGVVVFKFSRDFKRGKINHVIRRTGLKLYMLNSLMKTRLNHVVMTPSTYIKLYNIYGKFAEKYFSDIDFENVSKFYNLINVEDLVSSLSSKTTHNYTGRVSLYNKEYFIVVSEVFKKHNVNAVLDSVSDSIIFPDFTIQPDKGYSFMKLIKKYGEPVDFYKFSVVKHHDLPIRLYEKLGKFSKDRVIFIDNIDTLNEKIDEFGLWFDVVYTFLNASFSINKSKQIKEFRHQLNL